MSSKIKPWPQPMVESKGDYRAESFLEDHIGGKLYSQQRSLPRLPIPEVKDTLDRFLPTALPLAKSEEEKATLVKAVQQFEGQSVELQKRLIERREGEMKDSSWLQHWWNTLGYLQVRPRGISSRSPYRISYVLYPDLFSSHPGSRSRGCQRQLLLPLFG